MRTYGFRMLIAAAAIASSAMAASPDGVNAGGGCHRGDTGDQHGDFATMTENCSTPSLLRIEPGDRVTWLNKDETKHTVTGGDGRWGNYDPIAGSDRVSYAFADPGIYLYYCLLHPGMIGAIVVGDGVGTATSSAVAAPASVSRAGAGPEREAPSNISDASGAAAAADAGSDGIGSLGSLGIVAGVTGAVAALGAGMTLAQRRRARA